MNNPIWTNKMVPTWQPNPISINWVELIFRVTISWVGLDWRFFKSVSQVRLKNTRTQPNSYTPLYTIAFMKRKIYTNIRSFQVTLASSVLSRPS